MTTIELIVLFTTLAGIGLVNWFFFGARRAAVATRTGDRQEVTIHVKGGYEPSVVRVQSGAPIRLVFDRQETSGCSEEVVFPDFAVRKFLPAFQQTTVDLRPAERGTYEFTCGMSMLRGKLIVE